MQRVAILGATGSIGASALDVIARHPDRMRASVLAAGTRVDALLALCRVHRPAHAVIADAGAYAALRDGLRDAGLETEAHAGAEALDSLVAGDACDSVVAAIVGAAGLSSTLAAARAGKRLLLANKESLVLAGELLMQAAQAHGATIVPIDSEHNAIFQCLAGNPGEVPARITLTASGGPFRGWTRDALATVTPAQAVAHPKWSMGPKISVDSASLMKRAWKSSRPTTCSACPARGSTCWCIRNRWCIRSWTSSTAAPWPNSACRTCAPRWRWAWVGHGGSPPACPRSTCWRKVAGWISPRRTWTPSRASRSHSARCRPVARRPRC